MDDDLGVLVVDDQASFRAALASLVDGTDGFHLVAEAADAPSATRAVADTHPDLVLMDIHLAGASGIELTAELTADDPELTVVLMSTYAATDLPTDARRCGAAAYLHKASLTPATLRAAAGGTTGGWAP